MGTHGLPCRDLQQLVRLFPQQPGHRWLERTNASVGRTDPVRLQVAAVGQPMEDHRAHVGARHLKRAQRAKGAGAGSDGSEWEGADEFL